MKIATVEGYWSTNIGNSLFQISAYELLKEAGHEVIKVPDLPGYILPKKGNPKNYFEYMDHLECDYFCIQGPFFRKESDKILVELLKRLTKRGVKIIGLGVGAMHYDAEAINYYHKWLNEISFELITTRDELTYGFLKNTKHKFNLHNGIDLGFFISRFRPQPNFINNKKFICLNFDQIPEPKFVENKNGVIDIGGKNYAIEKSLSSEPKGYLKKLLPYYLPYLKTYKRSNLGGIDVIRLDHRYNPIFLKKIYSNHNSFAMDTPAGYLLAYANSQLTLSNRVHANVATLSYGNQAMYFSNSKRAKLIDRVGLNEIYNRPMKVSQDLIDNELNITLELLKNIG